MHAIIVQEFGGPEVLTPAELPSPQPGPGQVRIAVSHAAVNPVDTMIRSGAYRDRLVGQAPPYIVGMDAAGVIDALGPDVDERLFVGQHVVSLVLPTSILKGAYAQQIIVPQATVVAAPVGVDAAAASTLLMNAQTARMALKALAIPPGEWIAVTGAAGAFGGYTVQLAKAAGLQVIADAAPQDEHLVTSLGADVVLPRGDDFAARVRQIRPDGVSGLADGAVLFDKALPAVADGGRMAIVRGWEAPATRGIDVHWIMVSTGASDTAGLAELVQQVSDNVLTLRVADVLPADQAPEAHRRLEAGGLRGRLVLEF